jgi:hypothetical protein
VRRRKEADHRTLDRPSSSSLTICALFFCVPLYVV